MEPYLYIEQIPHVPSVGAYLYFEPGIGQTANGFATVKIEIVESPVEVRFESADFA